MRIPLFRGKKSGSDEWVKGFLTYRVFGLLTVQYYIFVTPNHEFEVDEETISCDIGVKGYTGDYENRKKNEVTLFEGDIVEAMSAGTKGTFIITYRNGGTPSYILYPAWQASKGWAIAASDLGRTKGDYYDDLRLIGNIHDNPEMVSAISDKLEAYMQLGNTSALHIEIGNIHE